MIAIRFKGYIFFCVLGIIDVKEASLGTLFGPSYRTKYDLHKEASLQKLAFFESTIAPYILTAKPVPNSSNLVFLEYFFVL